MDSRYGKLTVYSWGLALVAGAWLAYSLTIATGRALDWPPLWVIALCIAACLFVFQFGVRAPRVGLMSMERVPQMALLLTLSAPVAAAICAVASLLWPILNRGYSHGSQRVALLRGVHNAAMTTIMLMLAGTLYTKLGGRLPLHTLSLADTLPLLALAATAQVINITLMTLFFKFDRRDVRSIMTPSYALSDLIFVPAGILAALLFNGAPLATFALFVALMALFVLIFNSVGRTSDGANVERGPLARLFRARRALHGARSIDSLGERVVTEARTLFRFDEFYLALADHEKQLLEVRVHERLGARLPARTKPLGVGLFGYVIEQAKPLLVEDWASAPPELLLRTEITGKETGSVIAVPLMEQGAAIGVMSVQHTNANVYSQADLHLLERLADEVAAAVADARAFEDAEEYRQRLEQRVAERTAEIEKAHREKERLLAALRERSQRLERESQEDPLTGIANRRYFMQRLTAELELATAVGHPLTLAIADMDLFKGINDRLGHRVGDEALKQSAASMRALCGTADLVARIGGEEFAWILPGTDRDAASRFCEQVRAAIESYDWPTVHPDLKLTISVGLCQWDGKAPMSDLLHAADTQLYKAKREGRNRVA
jgi:diguanylate cyclase (GGDEF)-like protein